MNNDVTWNGHAPCGDVKRCVSFLKSFLVNGPETQR